MNNINDLISDLRYNEINAAEEKERALARQLQIWKAEAGAYVDQMLRSSQATLEYMAHPDRQVRKVAIALFASYWPPSPLVERKCEECIRSESDDEVRLRAIVSLSFVRSRMYGESVCLTLGGFLLDQSVSVAVRQKLYTMLVLAFGTLQERLAIVRAGSSGSMGNVTIDLARVHAWIVHDYTVKRRNLTESQEQALGLYLQGRAAYEGREYERANELLSKAIRGWPEVAGPYVARGRVQEQLGNYECAAADFSHAIVIAPNTAHVYLNRANVYRKMGYEALAEADEQVADQLSYPENGIA
jgi:tetratricopeptide (TPR) repeat protein